MIFSSFWTWGLSFFACLYLFESIVWFKFSIGSVTISQLFWILAGFRNRMECMFLCYMKGWYSKEFREDVDCMLNNIPEQTKGALQMSWDKTNSLNNNLHYNYKRERMVYWKSKMYASRQTTNIHHCIISVPGGIKIQTSWTVTLRGDPLSHFSWLWNNALWRMEDK